MALDLGYLLDELLVLKEKTVADEEILNSIDLATLELTAIYKEKDPYYTDRLITGIEYIFNDNFIEKARFAMSTDSLGDMNNIELQLWNFFVQYSDEFSTAADTTVNPLAIGCTVIDDNGDSFVVTEDGITTDLCTVPVSELEAFAIASALDLVFTKIATCEEWVAVDVELGDLENVSNCTL